MSESHTEPKSSTDILIWMIATQLLAVVSLVLWFSLVTDSMILGGDSGGGVLFLVIIYYPVYPIAMMVYSWIAYSSRKISRAVILSGLSGAPTILLYFALIIDGVIDKLL